VFKDVQTMFWNTPLSQVGCGSASIFGQSRFKLDKLGAVLMEITGWKGASLEKSGEFM